METSNKGVCIFDFDGTIRLGSGKIGEFAKETIEGCLSKGLKLAIVSASHDPALIKRTLMKLTPGVFPEPFFTSPAFQVGQENKTPMIEKVMQYYKSTPECMLLFDDANKQHADNVGIAHELVSPKTGITASNFQHGIQILSSRCNLNTQELPMQDSYAQDYGQNVQQIEPQQNKCPNLYLPDEWNVTPSRCENRQNGEVCEFECKPGFGFSSGSSTLMCINGRWSHSPLQCSSLDTIPFNPVDPYVTCPNLYFPTGVTPVSCASFKHGKVCEMSCESGWFPVGGRPAIACLNGKWTGAPLTCDRTYKQVEMTGKCTDIFIPTNANVAPTECIRKESGDTCNFACLPGFERSSGQSVLTCRNGQWSDSPLQCTNRMANYPPFDETATTAAAAPDYSRFVGGTNAAASNGVGNGNMKCPNLYLPEVSNVTPNQCVGVANGQECNFACKPGWLPTFGSFKLVCANGEWSGPPLQCTTKSEVPQRQQRVANDARKKCPPLYLPVNAHVSPASCVDRADGEVCNFVCQPGWGVTFGEANLMCKNGEWSGAPLQCTRELQYYPNNY
jgi:hypothetical protein